MSFFAVQTYRRSGRGTITEDAVTTCKTSDQAIRLAERLAPSRAGAVAFARSSNDFDEYSEPEFLAVFGEVPDHLAELIPASLSPVVPT